MIPLGFIIFSLIILNIFLIAIDFFVFKKWKKFILAHNYNKNFITIYKITFPLMAVFLYVNAYIRWTNPLPSSSSIILNYVLTFWFLPKVIFAIFIGLSSLFQFLKSKLRKRKVATFNTSRRKAIATLGWATASLPYFALAHETFKTTLTPKVKFVDVPIPNLDLTLSELRFVQLSDIHAGSLPSSEFFEKISLEVNLLKPDIIFITGDFVNFSPKELELLETGLKQLSAPIGVYGCLGNHEHYTKPSELPRLIEKIRDYGIDLLINENRTVVFKNSKLQIAGMDNTSHRMKFGDLDKTLMGLDPNLPTILLCHDPSNWDKEIRGKRKVDLILSGHTHGGQIGLELFGSVISPAAIFYKQYAGLYYGNDQYLYVNTGIGTIGVPVRAGLPPEITLLRLHPAERYA